MRKSGISRRFLLAPVFRKYTSWNGNTSKKDTNIRALEDTYIREQRLMFLEKSLATMPPRERLFAKYRYGFLDDDDRSIRRMRKEFNLTMQEFRYLEKRVFEYLHECLSDFCVYPWEDEYVDIESKQEQEKASY